MSTFLNRLLPSIILVLALGACSKKHDHAHDDGHNHAGHHAHVAPHGGTLVEIGAHQFNVEFVRDAGEGRLTAYILDGHAENFVRLPIQGFAVAATVDGRRESLPMAAVGNAMTGETVGDTSQFAAVAEWLKTTDSFSGVIPALDIRGTTFTNVAFEFRGAIAK
jgi:hypothetical protein